MSKNEISIATVKQITKEELQKYVTGNFTENNIRKTIQEQLAKSGENIVFKQLGLRMDSWSHKWELDSYGSLSQMVKKSESLINDVGGGVIQEIIKEVTPEDVIASLTQKNIQSLKKIYRETLFAYFENEVRNLAMEHGKEQAKTLFMKHLYEEENNSEQI